MKSSKKHEQVKKVKQMVKLPSCLSLFPVDFDIDQIPTQHDLSSVGHTLDSTCPCPWTPVALGNTRAWACDSSCAAYCLRDQIWLATKSGRTKSAFCVEDEMMGATVAAAIVGFKVTASGHCARHTTFDFDDRQEVNKSLEDNQHKERLKDMDENFSYLSECVQVFLTS